jgi:hypothetical protein
VFLCGKKNPLTTKDHKVKTRDHKGEEFITEVEIELPHIFKTY